MRRVTLKQIALKARVHVSTVSLALRDHPRIPAVTRNKIKKLAGEMGYVPDAAMSALASYRNALRPNDVQTGLAYLSDMPSDNPFGRMVFMRAKERARERGYHLVEYNMREQDISLERLHSIWWNSGLKGVLIGPFHESARLEGDWSRWPVVAYGYSVRKPLFNRAAVNHFQDMLIHLETLRDRGYRRIGLCLPRRLDARTGGQLRAGYLLFYDAEAQQRPRILNTRDADDSAQLKEWVESSGLDAVIAYREYYKSLLASGFKIPGDLGFSLMTKRGYDASTQKIAGFNTKADLLARHSIDFLISLIHEQAYGILESPRIYMVSGEYSGGLTIRAESK
jgi:LacI family transcriptional regulator